ncbi:MAG: hypothetical protein U0900_09305 [Myxococcota bacterium]
MRSAPARQRPSKVRLADEGRPLAPGATVTELLDALPKLLGAAELNAAIDAWAQAWRTERLVLFGFGAHLIKVGLAPVVVDLMERGAIGGLMMNGAGCVHDLELAMLGKTSEDVGPALDRGRFGMARETAERLNRAIARGRAEGLGMGAAVGRDIAGSGDPHADRSVLANAYRLGIPVTVHVAIGTDIHHMHPSADGAALGETSYRDFETLCGLVAGLEDGVVLHVGSAVILPEVFLKALAVARNLGHRVARLTTINCDFVRQYRPERNVVERPTRLAGRGISLIGHHEILVPLMAAGVVERHASAPGAPPTRRSRAAAGGTSTGRPTRKAGSRSGTRKSKALGKTPGGSS